MEAWFTHAAADGFNVMGASLPSGLETFVETVVPILRERGLFRREYAGATLREEYVPSDQGKLNAATAALADAQAQWKLYADIGDVRAVSLPSTSCT